MVMAPMLFLVSSFKDYYCLFQFQIATHTNHKKFFYVNSKNIAAVTKAV